MNLNQVTLPASDIERAVAFYCSLGFRQIVDSAHYARFLCPDGEATFSVHLAAAINPPGDVIVYFECEDLDDRVTDLKAKGIEFKSLPRDERWLWREARLLDPDGNELCLYFAGENRINPPWRVNPD